MMEQNVEWHTTPSGVSVIDDIQAGIDAWPWYKKLYYKVWHWGLKARCGATAYETRSWWQTLTQGYADREWWNFDWYSANYMLPRLKRLAEAKNSHPASLLYKIDPDYSPWTSARTLDQEAWESAVSEAACELWDSYMADMIYFLEASKNYNHMGWEPGSPEYKRYRRGKFLLFKYWESLWD